MKRGAQTAKAARRADDTGLSANKKPKPPNPRRFALRRIPPALSAPIPDELDLIQFMAQEPTYEEFRERRRAKG